MSDVRLVAKELKDVLNTITSFPVDWEELTISITVRSCADGAMLTKHMEYLRGEQGWVQRGTWE
jgi:hypothetical protein